MQESFYINILNPISMVQFGKNFFDDNINYLLVIDEFNAIQFFFNVII